MIFWMKIDRRIQDIKGVLQAHPVGSTSDRFHLEAELFWAKKLPKFKEKAESLGRVICGFGFSGRRTKVLVFDHFS